MIEFSPILQLQAAAKFPLASFWLVLSFSFTIMCWSKSTSVEAGLSSRLGPMSLISMVFAPSFSPFIVAPQL